MADPLALETLVSKPADARAMALRDDGRVCTRGDFHDRVMAWYGALAEAKQERLGLYEEDGVEFLAVLYAALYRGYTVVLPADNRPGTQAALQDQVGVFVGDFDAAVSVPAMTEASTTLPALDPLQSRIELYTSGSTGEPVRITKTLHQLGVEIVALEQIFGERLRGVQRVIGTVSHQHIYGLLFRLFWPLSCGRVFLSHRLAYPEDFAEWAQDEPCALVASPAHLKRLSPSLSYSPAHGAGFLAIFSSGGPLAEAAADMAREVLGISVSEVLGSSETGGIAYRGAETHGRWQALPGVELATDSNDHLRVRSQHLDPDLWVDTQDRVEMDDGGDFRLLGRSDRIAKIEEKRVSLTAVETTLNQLPWIVEARVLVLQGHRSQIGAVARLSPAGWQFVRGHGQAGLVRELQSQLRETLDSSARPRRWRFVREFPTNATGKTPVGRLHELFDENASRCAYCLSHRQEGARHYLRLFVPPHSRFFKGHFPEAPILPGVVQLKWAIDSGRRCFGIKGDVEAVAALKFQKIIQPGDEVDLDLEWVATSQQLRFSLESHAGRHASGRVHFRAPTP